MIVPQQIVERTVIIATCIPFWGIAAYTLVIESGWWVAFCWAAGLLAGLTTGYALGAARGRP